MSTDRPPLAEMAKRAGEAGAGLVAAAKAAATEGFVADQEAYEKRVKDSHELEMQLLGKEPSSSPKEDDEMRRVIMVTGDVYGDKAVESLHSVTNNPPGQQPSERPPEKKKPSLASKALPWVLASLIGPAGIAAGYLIPKLFEKAAPVIEHPTQEIPDPNAYGLSL